MYTYKNFKSKKELKEAVKRYLDMPGLAAPVRIYAPGLGEPKYNRTEFVEGPHYPLPHRWYAQIEVKDGVVVKVK